MNGQVRNTNTLNIQEWDEHTGEKKEHTGDKNFDFGPPKLIIGFK